MSEAVDGDAIHVKFSPSIGEIRIGEGGSVAHFDYETRRGHENLCTALGIASIVADHNGVVSEENIRLYGIELAPLGDDLNGAVRTLTQRLIDLAEILPDEIISYGEESDKAVIKVGELIVTTAPDPDDELVSMHMEMQRIDTLEQRKKDEDKESILQSEVLAIHCGSRIYFIEKPESLEDRRKVLIAFQVMQTLISKPPEESHISFPNIIGRIKSSLSGSSDAMLLQGMNRTDLVSLVGDSFNEILRWVQFGREYGVSESLFKRDLSVLYYNPLLLSQITLEPMTTLPAVETVSPESRFVTPEVEFDVLVVPDEAEQQRFEDVL